jgi:hypothetical protein
MDLKKKNRFLESGLDSTGLGQNGVAGSCSLGFHVAWGFLDELHNCQRGISFKYL